MKLNYMIFCDQATIDRETSKLSLTGLFDQIGAIGFPALQTQMFVVAEVFGVTGVDIDVGLTIRQKSNNKSIANLLEKQKFDPTISSKMSLVMSLRQVAFPEAGEYSAVLSINGTEFEAPGVLTVTQS